jgi:hypothetical protein
MRNRKRIRNADTKIEKKKKRMKQYLLDRIRSFPIEAAPEKIRERRALLRKDKQSQT